MKNGIEWYSKGKFILDDSIKEENKKDLSLIVWDRRGKIENSNIFLLENIINNHEIILFDNLHHRIFYEIEIEFQFLSDTEKQSYIFNNKALVHIYKNGNWEEYYWKDIPYDIKNRVI